VVDTVPAILEQPEQSDSQSRKNRAWLIEKIYEVDPLICPKCAGPMRMIAFVEDDEVIRRILGHSGLLETRHKPAQGAMFTPLGRTPPALFVAEEMADDHRSTGDDIVDLIDPVDDYF
jgi:hypothetical protein